MAMAADIFHYKYLPAPEETLLKELYTIYLEASIISVKPHKAEILKDLGHNFTADELETMSEDDFKRYIDESFGGQAAWVESRKATNVYVVRNQTDLLAGFIAFSEKRSETGEAYTYIEEIAVATASQKKGLGKGLLRLAMTHNSKLPVCLTTRTYADATALYKGQGFSVIPAQGTLLIYTHPPISAEFAVAGIMPGNPAAPKAVEAGTGAEPKK